MLMNLTAGGGRRGEGGQGVPTPSANYPRVSRVPSLSPRVPAGAPSRERTGRGGGCTWEGGVEQGSEEHQERPDGEQEAPRSRSSHGAGGRKGRGRLESCQREGRKRCPQKVAGRVDADGPMQRPRSSSALPHLAELSLASAPSLLAPSLQRGPRSSPRGCLAGLLSPPAGRERHCKLRHSK